MSWWTEEEFQGGRNHWPGAARRLTPTCDKRWRPESWLQIANFKWFQYTWDVIRIGISGMKSMAVTAWKHSEGLAQVPRHLQAHERRMTDRQGKTSLQPLAPRPKQRKPKPGNMQVRRIRLTRPNGSWCWCQGSPGIFLEFLLQTFPLNQMSSDPRNGVAKMDDPEIFGGFEDSQPWCFQLLTMWRLLHCTFPNLWMLRVDGDGFLYLSRGQPCI